MYAFTDKYHAELWFVITMGLNKLIYFISFVNEVLP